MAAASLASFEHVLGDPLDQRRARLQLAALRGVAQGDVGDLVRQHGRDFGGIVGERQEAAGHVEPPVGQREGVDGGGVQDRDLERLVRPIAGIDQAFGDVGQEPLGLRRRASPPKAATSRS